MNVSSRCMPWKLQVQSQMLLLSADCESVHLQAPLTVIKFEKTLRIVRKNESRLKASRDARLRHCDRFNSQDGECADWQGCTEARHAAVGKSPALHRAWEALKRKREKNTTAQRGLLPGRRKPPGKN
jgi:hypothetical protein